MSKARKRYIRKRVDFFRLIQKIKLWPSRRGILHGIKELKYTGEYVEVTTHCNQTFIIKNSKNSRAARWLRNKWTTSYCKACSIPGWKTEKFSLTRFNHHWGSKLSV